MCLNPTAILCIWFNARVACLSVSAESSAEVIVCDSTHVNNCDDFTVFALLFPYA